MKELLSNVGSGGGAAAAAGPGAAAGGAGGAAEEAKEEEKEEGMFNTSLYAQPHLPRYYANFQSREGRVRRGHGLRSFRLNSFRDGNYSPSLCTFTAWSWVSIHQWCGVKEAISGCLGQSSLCHRLI